jgi:hypothetical protein
MKHLICQIFPNGDYKITLQDDTLVKSGTCKEEADEGRVKINPNVAWNALQTLWRDM